MRIPRIAVTALSAGITVSTAGAQIPLAFNLTPLIQVSQESIKLTVRVVDTAGGAIPRAEVTLINQLEDHVQIKQTTNQESQVSFLVIPTERAIVMASKPIALTVALQIKSGSSADIIPLSKGQESTTFAIFVVDQQGAILPTAVVTLTGDATHFQLKRTADHEGHLNFMAIPTGSYSLSVSAPGFETNKQTVLLESQPLTITVVLLVGSSSSDYPGPGTFIDLLPIDETITIPEIAPYPIQALPADSKKNDKKKSR
jgi:Carboxypeptidase regulatory-like domain